ncbi:MAG: YdiU family protein, partial [Gammaproteobacteria bacterium]|nr:YdiU family protein [Gammaproteobacteria bacterium]
MIKIPFNNRYLTLGESFYVKHKPGPVANPALIKFNVELAEAMGLSPSDFDSDVCADIFSGNVVPEESEPIAMAYAGHQFGQYNPQLGDGRAIYLGEVDLPAGGAFDVQLKGSGPTSYSRNGDGRSALGPVLREYLVSEAMHQLNVPTTRALAAVTTGEQVVRENLIPGGIITRIASSFVRVGTFQFIAAQGNVNKVQALADYVIERNYPMALESDIPYVALLEMMVERQAMLIAKWIQLGFIHGVMNTDNMSVAGETIDYGPCAFMDIYAHDQVFSSIDYRGRYAYSNQPSIGLWNLTRLAESLLPLFSDDADEAVEIAKGILNKYIDLYEGAWLSGMRAKCGLTKSQDSIEEEDKALIETLLDTMANEHADFTLTFYYLS